MNNTQRSWNTPDELLEAVTFSSGGGGEVSTYPETTAGAAEQFFAASGVGSGKRASWSTKKVPAGVHCTHCSKWMACKADMVKHLRSHTGERPYRCPMCSYSATVKCNLTRHIAFKHKTTNS